MVRRTAKIKSQRARRVSAPFLLAARLLDIRATHRAMLERFAKRGAIAIMFTDIVDFTKATEAGGDKTATKLLDAHDAVVETHVRRAKGRIIKSLGDGSMAVFNDPADAVRAAVGILESVRDLPAIRGWMLRVRIGIDAGKPSKRGDDYIGHTVNLAARLTRRARPGEALVTEAVQASLKKLDGEARWEKLGEVALKGMATPPKAWRLRVGRARRKPKASASRRTPARSR
ncbi:MAG: adenylate/guanylate cyclase domain-containing protein [Actinobacteria bacterium]|nr:MAG: adenylate/guanylate cyclase domain-containing protein [Actinomycetota bacterium]